ncbi:xanthine dehydrogenase [Paramagnetospirillum marisnigri]|uniref:Xanthine dehydrogenase n=2 Tax=Paramagnetospirillum marisnigri TaxID=1285242 RepID=A0A178M7T0_9PROT|nr:xanthine dehydrogenase [Paramagnetospirillum marisnigri]
MAADDAEVLETALRWMGEGRAVRLAVVLATWGSAPRATGSYMAVASDGAFAGSVSGGCVESAVISEARELEDGEAPRVLSFGVEDETAWHVGLPCGGTIRVAVFHPVKALLERVVACHSRRIPTALALDLASGAQSLAEGDEEIGRLPQPSETLFIRQHEAPWTMIITGAVHISQILAGMARQVGFAVTVLDPRTAFAQGERFPGISLLCGEPEEVLAAMTLDRRTALVSVTHVPRLDDAALKMALASPAFYVGALGSTRTHAKRCQRLESAGIATADLERIQAPVGLDIGAKTPAEIAVSILAEVIAARRGKPIRRPGRTPSAG